MSPLSAISMAIFLGILFLISVTRDWFPLLDWANLAIHELGHFLWYAFGQTLTFLGGTINQLFVPLLIGFIFFLQGRFLSSLFCIWWMGENCINISVYIADANAQALNLVGGENSIHDWYWLLGHWGIRHQATEIALGVRISGIVLMLLSIVLAFIIAYLVNRKPGPLRKVPMIEL